MRLVFADSGYWIASMNFGDQLSERAKLVAASLGSFRIITSEMVLIEVLNHFSDRGELARKAAFDAIAGLKVNHDIDVVPLTSEQFAKAVDRYGSRLDQSWSLVDCSSFVLMEERGIRDALAHDIDFVQAGFNALLWSG